MAEQPSTEGADIRRPAWIQLYEELSPDEVDAIFRLCGYEILPTGLSRLYTVVQLGADETVVLEGQARSHGHTAAEEASAILAEELTRLSEAQSDEAGESSSTPS